MYLWLLFLQIWTGTLLNDVTMLVILYENLWHGPRTHACRRLRPVARTISSTINSDSCLVSFKEATVEEAAAEAINTA